MRVTFVILCCMLVTRVYSAYNCKRLEDCQNGGTCNDDGTCTCVAGTHYRCDFDNTVTCDTLDCGTNGQCVTDSGVDVCVCDYGYYGTNCESSLVEIDCTADSASYIVSFPESFDGTVEIVPADPATTVTDTCVISPTTANGYKTYNATFNLSTDGTTECPTSLLSPADPGENADYSALLIVRYWQSLSTSLDELYNLTCRHAGGEVEVYQDISNVSLTVTGLDQVTQDKSISPIEMALTKDSDTVFDSQTSLIVGDKFDVNVYLNVGTGSFTAVRLESCVANNTLEDGESKIYKVFENGCPTARGKATTSEQEDTSFGGKNGKKITITAFKFRDSQKIGLVCTAKACKTAEDCNAPTNCADVRAAAAAATATTPTDPPTDPPTETPTETPTAANDLTTSETTADGSRKRRAAGEETPDNEERTVSAVITVLNPGETLKDASTGEEQVETTVGSCLAHSSIFSVIVVLGVIILILFIACLVMAVVLMRRRERKLVNNELVQPERFQIPRAHVNSAYNDY